MKFYSLKVYAVLPGMPRHEAEAECKTELFRNEGDAYRYCNWFQMDQGRKDTEVVEHWIECPMLEETVFIPDNIL